MGYYLAYLGVPDLGHPKIPNNKAATLKKKSSIQIFKNLEL
jgi:hypothetical protein